MLCKSIQDEIHIKCGKILEEKSRCLTQKTEEYIKQYNNAVKAAFVDFSLEIDFDAGYAFASALAKVGIIGGLGSFMTSFAAFMFGSATFIAGAGGTAAIIAGTLGPIGIAVGIIVAAILGLFRIFGGGWEKKVAKKLINAYEEKQIIERYDEGISKYWKDTKDAFNEAAIELEKEWEKYVRKLKDMVESYDINAIEKSISELENIKVFFENIPS